MSDEGDRADPSPFKYHLELTPAQLKMTHTALRSLLDDFGHEEADVQSVIRDVLEKLPDEHAIRAIRLDDELDRKLARKDPATAPDPGPSTEPPDSVA